MESDAKPKARLYVQDPLEAGATLTLGKDQARYLVGVLRLGAGAQVALFNGRDGEWLSTIGGLSKSAVTLRLGRQTRPQTPEPDLWLAFAPLKKSQTDMVVEKATELGVSRLLPVFTQFTNSGRVNTDRMMANAIEASEQCERLTLPGVAEPVALDALLANWPSDRLLLVLDEQGGGVPLARLAQDVAGVEQPNDQPGTPAAGILVGPEGGFAASEFDAISRLVTARRIGLGPRILRAETAAIAALATWQLIAGDGTQPPRAL